MISAHKIGMIFVDDRTRDGSLLSRPAAVAQKAKGRTNRREDEHDRVAANAAELLPHQTLEETSSTLRCAIRSALDLSLFPRPLARCSVLVDPPSASSPTCQVA